VESLLSAIKVISLLHSSPLEKSSVWTTAYTRFVLPCITYENGCGLCRSVCAGCNACAKIHIEGCSLVVFYTRCFDGYVKVVMYHTES